MDVDETSLREVFEQEENKQPTPPGNPQLIHDTHKKEIAEIFNNIDQPETEVNLVID